MIEGIVDIINNIFNDNSIPSSGLIRSAIFELLDSSLEALAYIIIGGISGELLDAYLERIWNIKKISDVHFVSLVFKLVVHISGILVIITCASEFISRIPSPFSGQIGKSAGMLMLFTSTVWRSPHLRSVADEIIDRIEDLFALRTSTMIRDLKYKEKNESSIMMKKKVQNQNNQNFGNSYYYENNNNNNNYEDEEEFNYYASLQQKQQKNPDFMQALFHL